MKRPLTTSRSFKAIEETEHDDVSLIKNMATDPKHEDKLHPFAVNAMDEAEDDDNDDELSLLHGQSALGEKKRRLSVDQVKALEQNFEIENKLDPERKVRLAQELGLQPRQVAVWFQNRRARWKTKQLERDYGALKSRYDALKMDCDSLRLDKETLMSEIKDLKAKLESNTSLGSLLIDSTTVEEKPAMMYRDGASDSDSSAVFNDETSPYSGVVLDQNCSTLEDFRAHCSSFLFDNMNKCQDDEKEYLDEGLLSGEELCSGLFSEEQPTGLSWYCSVQEWD